MEKQQPGEGGWGWVGQDVLLSHAVHSRIVKCTDNAVDQLTACVSQFPDGGS